MVPERISGSREKDRKEDDFIRVKKFWYDSCMFNIF